MMYCYIFDYSDCSLNCIFIPNKDDEREGEDILTANGFNPDECSWMFSSTELNINYIVDKK